jgi:hypothetical protein
MEQYPTDLFKAVAQNILRKKKAGVPMFSFSKEANVIDYRQQFMTNHKLTPDLFEGDRTAERKVQERKELAGKQIQDYYKAQSATFGGLTPEMKQTEKNMLAKLNDQASQANVNHSIDRTRTIANTNPEQFKEFRGLANQSEKALSQTHGKEVGTVLGGLGGAGLGLLAGRRLPKNSTGLLQQVGGSILGGTVGGLTGSAVGANRDEKRTGFNHEDILKPYEIADRMQNQKKFQ